MSSEENRPAFRTTMRSPSSSHSSTEPGPTPSFWRTFAGTEIWPCAVSFECASAMEEYYHGNELRRATRSWAYARSHTVAVRAKASTEGVSPRVAPTNPMTTTPPLADVDITPQLT